MEFAGLAPVPFAGMILADFGASVTTVDRVGEMSIDTMTRNKRSLAVNLKDSRGKRIVTSLASKSDVLLEPFRPGVMEKLGLGPEHLMPLNPQLIYARLTGYGQKGPLAQEAGHDINYLAISGVLSKLGRQGEAPYAPLNLVGDFAGGSLMCVIGILMALFNRQATGKGQVIDCSMVDGASYLSSFVHTSEKLGIWKGKRGTNMLDSGAPFYETYKTSDNKFIAVGAIEPKFYRNLLKGLGLDPADLPEQMDKSSWKEMKQKFSDIVATKTQQEWASIFRGTDSCVVPVLELDEAARHPHNRERNAFVQVGSDQRVPAPAPRLSDTPGEVRGEVEMTSGQHSREVLQELGYSAEDIDQLLQEGVVEEKGILGKL